MRSLCPLIIFHLLERCGWFEWEFVSAPVGAPTSPPGGFLFKKANTHGGPPCLNRLGNLAGVVVNQSNASQWL